MPMAYVMLNLEPGDEGQILRSLRKIAAVEEAHRIYGVYDIIVKVRADNMDKLRETVSKHMRSLDKVRSTLTMIVIEQKKGRFLGARMKNLEKYLKRLDCQVS